MPFYEIMTVAAANASAPHLASLLQKCQQVLVRRGGVLRGIDNLGVRPLASRMRAHSKYNEMGRYIRLRVMANPQALDEIRNRLKNDDSIVRMLVLKQKESLAPKRPQDHPSNKPFIGDEWELTEKKHRAPPPSDAIIGQSVETDYFASLRLAQAGLFTRQQLETLPKWAQQLNEEFKQSTTSTSTSTTSSQSSSSSSTSSATENAPPPFGSRHFAYPPLSSVIGATPANPLAGQSFPSSSSPHPTLTSKQISEAHEDSRGGVSHKMRLARNPKQSKRAARAATTSTSATATHAAAST